MTKTERRNRAIARVINDLECAHIELRYVPKQGSPEWHRTTARIYDATADLIELGIPMTLGGMYSGDGARHLRADAQENRRIAGLLERPSLATKYESVPAFQHGPTN